MYIKKWKKETGEYLELSEYNLLLYSATRKGIALKDYLGMYGIEESMSTGDIQDPLSNSAKLTYWVKEKDGDYLFLTQWKYRILSEEAKSSGKPIKDYLVDNGYVRWGDLFKYQITGWISVKDKLPLSRKKYRLIYSKLDKNEKIEDKLLGMGYVRINSKKEVN